MEHCSWHFYSSTVVDIFIPPPSFKPVSLSLSRISFYSKTPKQVFFNPINIFWHLLHTLFYYYQFYFFRWTFKIFIFTAYQLLKEKHRKKLLMEKVSRNKMKKVLHNKQEKYDRTADYNIHSIKWTEEDLMNKIKIARNMYASCFNGNSCHVR